MTHDKNWREIVKDADLYLKLGQVNHYLSGNNEGDYPWELAESCEPGGTHRINISTDVWFEGCHVSGLVFKWSFGIEPFSANGNRGYMIDTFGVRRVMSLLHGAVRRSFQKYLADCAIAVRKSAVEFQEAADKERVAADTLQELSVQE